MPDAYVGCPLIWECHTFIVPCRTTVYHAAPARAFVLEGERNALGLTEINPRVRCSNIRLTEPIPTWLGLSELQYVDGLGEFPGLPGAAAELGEDFPDLELGVCPFAEGPELRVGAVGLFLGFGLVLALVGDFRPGAALVSLMGT